jgi:hypothetical protein
MIDDETESYKEFFIAVILFINIIGIVVFCCWAVAQLIQLMGWYFLMIAIPVWTVVTGWAINYMYKVAKT